MKRSLVTMDDAHSQNAYYSGEHGDWYIAAAVHRDSESIDRSNFAVLRERLGAAAIIERSSHWAVGWLDYLIIAPNDRAAIRKTLEAKNAIELYPVLDDSHLSDLEWNEFHEFAESELKQFPNWADCLHEALEESNSGPGDEGAEWDIIEAARAKCEKLTA